MLTTVEKVLFFLLAVVSLYAAYVTFGRMIRTILRGQGQISIGSKGRFVVDFLVALLYQGGIIHRRPAASARLLNDPKSRGVRNPAPFFRHLGVESDDSEQCRGLRGRSMSEAQPSA